MEAPRTTCIVCLEVLRPDGTCRHRCDPKLARPGRRVRKSQKGTKPTSASPAFSAVEVAKVSKALRQRDPIFRYLSDKGSKLSWRRRSLRNKKR